MDRYRDLTLNEITVLESQMCTAEDWTCVKVSQDFSPEHVRYARFSGNVCIGAFNKEFLLAGGMRKHSGLYHVTLHNVIVGDDCCIENVKNYIANYEIGNDTFIENVDIILTDCYSCFGNGVEVSVLNETGGCDVVIYDRLSAQTAYVMAVYRHRPEIVAELRRVIEKYIESISSSIGRIGSYVVIADAGYIKNVRIGDYCKIEGASRLKNGSINSNHSAPVHIGVNVVGDDFIVSSGAEVEDGVTFSRCFIGQSCKLGHNYSATDSLFFGNCHGENGEACSVFAGPFTVTHHKSTLLIAGMFSFMNAGSGSNQSNHMYKLGPIHHGIMERGAKTASDSYILWPAKVGAFSLVMGRHVSHQDTSDLPFSYLIEQQNTTYIMPGANLKSVGTIRDAMKWPVRDRRSEFDRLDQINCNLLSPFVVQKMLNGISILKALQRLSGENSESYAYQSGKIKRTSLLKGLRYYGMAIDKFLGNSLISRIVKSEFGDIEGLRSALLPDSEYGDGNWIDVAGMIAPDKAIEAVLLDIQNGTLADVDDINARFREIGSKYYDYEWSWAYKIIEEYYEVDLKKITSDGLREIIGRWKSSVVGLDELVYEDARKDFAYSSQSDLDFKSNPFVVSIRNHIIKKSELYETIVAMLNAI